MNSDRDKGQSSRENAKPDTSATETDAAEPEWAGGLRKLYDSVVEEPLPDSFKDLLEKLDGGK